MRIEKDTAIIAKTKGFYLPAIDYYYDTNSINNNPIFCQLHSIQWHKLNDNRLEDNIVLAPTQSELQTWLRDEHEIHIEISRSFNYYVIKRICKYDTDEDVNIVFDIDEIIWEDCGKYEEALEIALVFTLSTLEDKLK